MYTLNSEGVTLNGSQIPNDTRNKDWKIYLAWLEAGNTPDPLPPPVVHTIDDEYNELSDWVKEALGPDTVGIKARIAARRS